MKYIVHISGIFILLIGSLSCGTNQVEPFIENADFEPHSHTLFIDYKNSPDTSILQIIEFSGIRKSGYGLLLNLDKACSVQEIDTIKRKLQKLDINAIHSFDVVITDSIDIKLKTAIGGAKFLWLLDNVKSDWHLSQLGKEILKIQRRTENRVLIIKNK